MDNNAPEAPTPAPADASDKTPTNTNPEPAQAPAQPTVDLGLTSEQAEKFKTFIQNSGGFDNAFKKLKTDVSQPKGAENVVEAPQMPSEPKNDNQPISQSGQAPEPFKTPQGAITASEFLAEQYFRSLASEEKYANISKEIANGEYLKEMSAFGIQPLNQDGSINDQKVRMYLDLKSQTVPAKPTESEPNASAAPTVTYTEVGDNISSIDQAYKVLMEPGNPGAQMAEEYIKNYLNPNSGNNKKM